MTGQLPADAAPTVEFPALPLPASTAPRRRRRLGDLALAAGAVLGALCLLATIVCLSLGVRPVVFETGSMAPTIGTGSLGMSRSVPATEVAVGDVVGVTRDDGVRVTHRVVSVDGIAGNSATLTLRGDANAAPDPQQYVVTEVNRVYGTVPLLGYAVIWLKNPYTLALQGLAAVFLLGIAFAPRRGWRYSPAAQRLVAGTAAVSVVALTASTVHGPGDAQAALTDSATATGSVQAGLPHSPTSLTCTDTETRIILLPYSTVELSWPNPPANSRYTYELSFPGQSTSPINIAATSLGNPAVYKFQDSILSNILTWLFGGSSYEVRLTYKVGNFRSATTVSQQLRATTPIIEVPAGIKCVTEGQANARAARQSRPSSSTSESSEPSESSEASEPNESSESSESEKPDESASSSETEKPDDTKTPDDTQTPDASTEQPTPDKPQLPAGGTPNDAGSFQFYRDGATVLIRDAASTEIEFQEVFPAGSSVAWRPGTEILVIDEPDGAVTTVEKIGNRWVTDRTPAPQPATQEPQPTATAEPTPEAQQAEPDARSQNSEVPTAETGEPAE